MTVKIIDENTVEVGKKIFIFQEEYDVNLCCELCHFEPAKCNTGSVCAKAPCGPWGRADGLEGYFAKK